MTVLKDGIVCVLNLLQLSVIHQLTSLLPLRVGGLHDGEPHVILRNALSLRVDSRLVRDFELLRQIGFGHTLNGVERFGTEAQLGLKILPNLAHQAPKRGLWDKEVCPLLELPDFAQCNSPRAEAALFSRLLIPITRPCVDLDGLDSLLRTVPGGCMLRPCHCWW